MKIPKYLEQVPAREGGTYVVMTKCQHWGRGTTLLEALTQARKAGARKFSTGNLLVYWQADATWQAIKSTTNPDACAPHVSSGGWLCWYGEKTPEMLVKP